MTTNYDMAVNEIKAKLDHSDEYAGIVFAAHDPGESLTATWGTNPAKEGENIVPMLGVQLLELEDAYGLDTEEIVQSAVQWVKQKRDADDPMFFDDHSY